MQRPRLRPCVLLVEDQLIFRTLLIEILSRECDLLTTENGYKAIKIYEDYAPDIVFLDIHLPDINGQEVLGAIASIDPSSFVVMFTASHSLNDIEKAAKQGAKGYIAKPFTKQKIDDCVMLWRNMNAKP